jgi:hypothetical protein
MSVDLPLTSQEGFHSMEFVNICFLRDSMLDGQVVNEKAEGE